MTEIMTEIGTMMITTGGIMIGTTTEIGTMTEIGTTTGI